jgi:hypothetical protein
LAADGKSFVKLPEPTMPDGLDAAAQRRVVEQAAGPRRRAEDLLRKSIVAPFVLQIRDVPAPNGEEPFRRVDVWYVAHGQLEAFFDEALFETLVDLAPAKRRSRLPVARGVLGAEELRRRGLQPTDSPALKERYCYSTIDLFDRVLVSTTRRVAVTIGPDSVLVAAVIDPRFTQDPQYPNLWRPLEIDERGRFTLGAPQPYVHSGSYTKITRFCDAPDALFLEHHYVFAEPRGWFGGRNLLRSKLPLAIQSGVRRLRRQLSSQAASN